MAIVKMNQFTLLTFDSYKDTILKELQKFENIQFKDLQRDDARQEFLTKESFAENVSAIESELAKIKFTLSKITPFAQRPSGMKALTTPKPAMSYDEFDSYVDTYDYASVYEAVKEADEKLKALKTEKDRVKAENLNLGNWLKLDVSIKEIDRLKTIKYFVGTINKALADSFRENIESSFPCAYIEFFGTVKDEVTALIIVPADDDEISAMIKNAGFTKMTLNFEAAPSAMITENNAKIAKIEMSQASLSESFQKYGSEYHSLQIAYDFFQTALARAKACENFLKLESVLLIEGWVPQELSKQLTEVLVRACGNDYYLEENAVEKDSADVPIKLKNNNVVAAFEEITSMYSMPRYNELDPTPILMPFYWLFFGIMVGDAGYGILLLIATTVALKCFNLGKGARNFMKFLFYLSFSTILAGVMFGSAFGFTFFAPIPTSLNDSGFKPILDSQLDITVMIVLSIVAGVAQVLFGIGVKGYILVRDGKILDAIFDSLFWIIALVSAIALVVGAAGMLTPAMMSLAKWGLYGSLIGLVLTQGRDNPSLGGKIGYGIYGTYGITGYVGDLISYTRLAALSLSGAYIAYSFNIMMGLVPGTLLKYVAGALIFLFGQSLNLALAVLGAYVHSCRLQYVEFFGKFYEGGGKPFKPFELKNNYVEIRR